MLFRSCGYGRQSRGAVSLRHGVVDAEATCVHGICHYRIAQGMAQQVEFAPGRIGVYLQRQVYAVVVVQVYVGYERPPP